MLAKSSHRKASLLTRLCTFVGITVELSPAVRCTHIALGTAYSRGPEAVAFLPSRASCLPFHRFIYISYMFYTPKCSFIESTQPYRHRHHAPISFILLSLRSIRRSFSSYLMLRCVCLPASTSRLHDHENRSPGFSKGNVIRRRLRCGWPFHLTATGDSPARVDETKQWITEKIYFTPIPACSSGAFRLGIMGARCALCRPQQYLPIATQCKQFVLSLRFVLIGRFGWAQPFNSRAPLWIVVAAHRRDCHIRWGLKNAEHPISTMPFSRLYFGSINFFFFLLLWF